MRKINAKMMKPDITGMEFFIPGKMILEKLEKMDKIISILVEKQQVETKEIMNIDELSHYTGFSVARLYKLKLDGKLPFSQAGRKGKIFFVKKEIDFWLQNL